MVVLLKAYLLNMVWSCYKFLRLRQELMRIPPVSGAGMGGSGGQSTMTPRAVIVEAGQLLPDYDAAQKHPYNLYPAPPPYAMATQMPTVEQIVAPPPSYQDVAGTSQQQQDKLEGGAAGATAPSDVTVTIDPNAAGAAVPVSSVDHHRQTPTGDAKGATSK